MSLLLTRLNPQVIQEAIMSYSSDEMRVSDYSDVIYGLQDAKSFLPADMIARLKESADQATQIPAINRDAVSRVDNIVTDCNFPADDETSAMYNVVYTARSFAITLESLPDNNNNYIDRDVLFAQKFRNGMNGLASDISNQYVTQLELDKTQIVNADVQAELGGLVGGAIEIAAVDADDFYNSVDGYFYSEDFYGGQLNNVHGVTRTMSNVRKYTNQGANNQKNLIYQFDANNNAINYGISTFGKSFTPSNRIAGNEGFIMPPESSAILSFAPQKFKTGFGDENGQGRWSMVPADVLAPFGLGDIEMGVFAKASCDSLNPVESYRFVTYTATLTKYNSDPVTQASRILKYRFI